MTKKKSRRTVAKNVEKIYCRKCQEKKDEKNFYMATDRFLDSNEKFSVCKQCCLEIWEDFYITERTLNKTFLKMSRVLNVAFDTDIVDSVSKELNKKDGSGRKMPNPFALYMRRIGMVLSRSNRLVEENSLKDLTFYPPVKVELSDEDRALMSFDKFWGEDYTPDDVDFLEEQYAEYRNNYDISDHSAKELLKRLCKKHLELREADAGRLAKSTASLEKEMIALMKELSISPNSTNAASANKMKSTFGVWVEEIEKQSPAEWLEDDNVELYRDYQGWDRYFKNFVLRPLQNYFSGTTNEVIEDENGKMVDWGISDE